MFGKGLTIAMRGSVSIHGPIDEQREHELRTTVQSIKGIRGRCEITCTVEDNIQEVELEIPWASESALKTLDQILRGYGGMSHFFEDPVDPVVTSVY